MRGWDEHIRFAVLDEHGYGDVASVEAPMSKKRKIIVHPTPHTVHRLLRYGFADDLMDFGARQLRLVRLAEIEVAKDRRWVCGHAFPHRCVLALQFDAEDALARLGPSELLDVLGIHPVEPSLALEARSSIGRDADRARRANHSIREESGAG